MPLPAERDAVAQRLQVMHNALGPFPGKRMVRVGAALDRIQTGVDVVSRRRAHRCRLKTVGEQHAFRGELVDVRRVCLAAIASDIAKRTVIRHDEEKIRFLLNPVSLADRREKKQGDGPEHALDGTMALSIHFDPLIF